VATIVNRPGFSEDKACSMIEQAGNWACI